MKCPKCEQTRDRSKDIIRIPRSSFDRLIPFSQRFMCLMCGEKFLKAFRIKKKYGRRANNFTTEYKRTYSS